MSTTRNLDSIQEVQNDLKLMELIGERAGVKGPEVELNSVLDELAKVLQATDLDE